MAITRENAPAAGTTTKEDQPGLWRCGSTIVMCGSKYYSCGGSYIHPRQAQPAAGTITRESAPI